MSKIAVIADTHFGAKNSCTVLLSHQVDVLCNCFLRYLATQRPDVKHIIHLGDVFDKKKTMDIQVLYHSKIFFDKLEYLGYKVDLLVGNHDLYYTNSKQIHTLEVLKHYPNITIHTTTTTIDGLCLVPWINHYEQEEEIKKIRNSSAKICLGHLEVDGANLGYNVFAKSELKPEIFDKFKVVFSGHFHLRHKHHNINYIGSPYAINFGEVDYPDFGFCILDTDTLEIEYVDIQERLFKKVVLDNVASTDELDLEHTFLKVVINESCDKNQNLLKEIQNLKVHSLSVVDKSITNQIQSGIKLDLNKSIIELISDFLEQKESADLYDKNKVLAEITEISKELLSFY